MYQGNDSLERPKIPSFEKWKSDFALLLGGDERERRTGRGSASEHLQREPRAAPRGRISFWLQKEGLGNAPGWVAASPVLVCGFFPPLAREVQPSGAHLIALPLAQKQGSS